jgi:hypothetical protein
MHPEACVWPCLLVNTLEIKTPYPQGSFVRYFVKKLQQPLFSCYLEVLVVFAMSFLHGSCMQVKFLKGAKAPTGFTNIFLGGYLHLHEL